MNNICSNCNKNFKVLTREGLCAYCHQDLNNEWSIDFQKSKKEQDKKC